MTLSLLHSRSALPLAALSLLLAPMAAQGPEAIAEPSDLRIPIHTAADDPVGGAYGIWAAGSDYKASFHAGATFVPYLGKDYPQNQPFHWRTTSVTVGGQSLLANHTPRLSYTDYRAEYDLGEVIEAYDVRSEGLEQTFVINRRPANTGPLVVRGVVTTDLTAAPAKAAHQALEFYDHDGRHILTYGAATAIDAAGRTQPMTTSFAEGQITLTLDAEWLAQAAFPLVVDPLVGAVGHTTGAAIGSLDLVTASRGVLRVWTAYDRWVSAVDADIFGHRTNADGSQRTPFFSDITASWSSEEPALAYNAAASRAIVALVRVFPAFERHAIRFHFHDDNDLNPGTSVIALSSSVTQHDWRVDVGGNHGQNSNVLVVFQRDEGNNQFANTNNSKVLGVFVDMSTNAIGSPFDVSNAPLLDSERPSVNQIATGSLTNYWAVAYQQTSIFALPTSLWDVRVRKVRGDGNVSDALAIDTEPGRHKLAPKIDGRDGIFTVVTTSSTSVEAPGKIDTDVGHQIRATRIYFPGPGLISDVPYGTKVVQSNNDARLRVGDLAYNLNTDSHWLLMFASTVTDNLYVRHIGYTGGTIESRTLASGVAGTTALGAVGFTATDGSYALAYGHGNSNLWNTNTFILPAVATPSLAGTGCSGAAISWSGPQIVGSEFCRVRVFGAPANALHFLLVGTGTTDQPLIGIPGISGGCWLLVPNTGPGHVGVLDFQIGADVEWSLSIPESLSSGDFYFQDFHSDSAFTELFSTQRLQVPIVR
jgi:hypothetical protein